ncbi:MAG: 2-oxoglutarate ferredoxin oxidoreductase subunit alpha [Bacteroidetes bacterium RIFCSPLOWO2_02_FULL_36_8]|nr:MAG: 2-oxoglutarate ferredoxin oxidoreductase subunit alpha [Bacteroidetes bacterium RIFCSPLOWO2_02_FULL_36_8]
MIETEAVVIRFSGDSGDGMQLTGTLFSDTSSILGNDICTFPDYPSEIRAPIGTVAGVSGFQVQIGSREIFTPGDEYDVLVAMNAAALKVELKKLKKGGTIIANTNGFDSKNLRLAGYPENVNPLEDNSLENYQVISIDISHLTKECLKGIGLSTKETERTKNMFVLGLLFWLFDRNIENALTFIKEKFSKNELVLNANVEAIKAGNNYGDNLQLFSCRYKVNPAKLPTGKYRSVNGNQAVTFGLIAASMKSALPLFLGSYPITPASDILHELSKYRNLGVKTFQAEDEIAGVCSAIGASYSGCLSVTTTSGPGMSLKTEALGLACILEIPLVIVNVQRGGPSTGLPTKTEQADLFQAFYGRHGEAPIPVLAASTPSNCFEITYEACRIAIEYMTPVIILSDGYIANGTEPWKFPAEEELNPIMISFISNPNSGNGHYLPYKRDEKLSRPWVLPGTKGMEYRIGGLEKQHETGNVCYEPLNHEKMVRLRDEKIRNIAKTIPLQKIDNDIQNAEIAVVTWGSTYGSVKTAVKMLTEEGIQVAHIHIHYLNPFPSNLGELLKKFDKILIPEMNMGQLAEIIKSHFLIPVIQLNKIQGQPFTVAEVMAKVRGLVN